MTALPPLLVVVVVVAPPFALLFVLAVAAGALGLALAFAARGSFGSFDLLGAASTSSVSSIW